MKLQAKKDTRKRPGHHGPESPATRRARLLKAKALKQLKQRLESLGLLKVKHHGPHKKGRKRKSAGGVVHHRAKRTTTVKVHKTKAGRVKAKSRTHRVSSARSRSTSTPKTRRISTRKTTGAHRATRKRRNTIVATHPAAVPKVRRIKQRHPLKRRRLTAAQRATLLRRYEQETRKRTAVFGQRRNDVLKYGRLAPERPVGLKPITAYVQLPAPPVLWNGPEDDGFNYGMCGNDEYGDCEFAGFVHGSEAVDLLLEDDEENVTVTKPTDAQVVQAYLAFTGGADQGCVTSQVLHKLYTSGILGISLVGYAPLDGDLVELCSAVALFGTAALGVLVPAIAEQQFNDGEPWDLTNTSADEEIVGAHCVYMVAFDLAEEMAEVLTWGRRQRVTFRWLQKNLEEKWAVIYTQIRDAGRLGDSDIAQLEDDLAGLPDAHAKAA